MNVTWRRHEVLLHPAHSNHRHRGPFWYGGAIASDSDTTHRAGAGREEAREKQAVPVIASRIWRAVLAAVLLVAAFAANSSIALAQCGETIEVAPRHSTPLGAAPLAVGDSVLYDAAERLAGYGFRINAMVCRTMAQGIAYLAPRAATLPELVVVALGTNGAVTTGQIDQLLAILGPSRGLALVTPRGGNYAYVPGLFRSVARQHPGRILVLDWNRLSAGRPDWFAPDGIHLGGAAGIDAYARLVASALTAMPSTAPAASPPAPAAPSPDAPPAASPSTGRPPRRSPESTRRPTLTRTERSEIERTLTYVRLFVSAVMTRELSLLGM